MNIGCGHVFVIGIGMGLLALLKKPTCPNCTALAGAKTIPFPFP